MGIMKIKGEVKSIGELQTFSSGFQKRELVIVETDEKAKYPQTLPFVCKKDKVSLLDKLHVGDKVEIDYVYSSHDWENPKTGKTQYFVSFDVLKLKVTYSSGGTSAPQQSDDESYPEAQDESGAEDMPF